MVQLEITLVGREKSFTAETLQECVEKFYDGYGEAEHEVVKCHTFEASDPSESMSISGNKSCVAWLKQMKQGVINEK